MESIKKICSFNVSDWHFITMITPYINKKIQNNENIKIYTMQDETKTMKTFLSKLSINQETRQKIADLNWDKSIIKKYSQIESQMGNNIGDNVTVIIKGDNSYIEKINSYLEKWLDKNKSKNITIVNCYEVMQFNQNIDEILNKHDKILNTSGEKEIEDVFEGFTRKVEDVS